MSPTSYRTAPPRVPAVRVNSESGISNGALRLSRAARADKRGKKRVVLSAGRHGRVRVSLGDIPYDEQHLSGTHQAEIAPRNRFNG